MDSKHLWLLLAVYGLTACASAESPRARLEGGIERPVSSPRPLVLPSPQVTTVATTSPPPPAPAIPILRDAAASGAGLLPYSRLVEETPASHLDIVLFNRRTGDLSFLPEVNTPADEFFPSFSHQGRFLTFTTTVTGDADIHRYDFQSGLIDTLSGLNTSATALRAVSSDDGNLIALSEREGDRVVMVLYDFPSKARLIPAPVHRAGANPLVRDISPDGRFVAFSALSDGQADIAFYEIGTDRIVVPPFVNGPFNDTSPTFGVDGEKMLFVSDRRGSLDIFMVNLATGLVDSLPLLNSPDQDVDPVFLPNGIEIIFQSNRTGRPNLFIYNLETHMLDTAPLANPDDEPNFETGSL